METERFIEEKIADELRKALTIKVTEGSTNKFWDYIGIAECNGD